jgi:predicted exporter
VAEAQVAEATQRVEARYEDAMDSAILRGVAARTRLVPQARARTTPSHRPTAKR